MELRYRPDPARELSANRYDICHCCVYSEKLLMMDRGTVRNMQSFIQRINQRKQFFFAVALRPNAGHGLFIYEVSRSHKTTHHSRQDSSGRVISSSQRPLPDNTQHSQQTNIHAHGGIPTHDISRRAAADLRLRPRGHWDRQLVHLVWFIIRKSVKKDFKCKDKMTAT